MYVCMLWCASAQMASIAKQGVFFFVFVFSIDICSEF